MTTTPQKRPSSTPNHPLVHTRTPPGRFQRAILGPLSGAFLLCASTACQQDLSPTVRPDDFNTQRSETTRSPASINDPAQPAAIVNGSPIPWASINPAMRELAGAAVLTDAVLDIQLDREFRRLALELPVGYARAERDLLLASIRETANVTDAESQSLLEDLKLARGLGPTRFDDLLRRNAMLRALAQARVQDTSSQITQADVQRRFDILHGPKLTARLITTPTEREAITARAAILAGTQGSLSDRFARAAVQHSTDSTGPRGGLLEPISLSDPSYESAIRRALASLEVGQLSETISFERGFALLMLEQKLPADSATIEDAGDAIRSELEARQVRLLMDRFARELLDKADVTIFDRSLQWAWEPR